MISWIFSRKMKLKSSNYKKAKCFAVTQNRSAEIQWWSWKSVNQCMNHVSSEVWQKKNVQIQRLDLIENCNLQWLIKRQWTVVRQLDLDASMCLCVFVLNVCVSPFEIFFFSFIPFSIIWFYSLSMNCWQCVFFLLFHWVLNPL